MVRNRPVTPASLLTMSPLDIIHSISSRVLEDIPEGVSTHEDLTKLEVMLGRIPNDYAYVIELLSYSRNYVRYFKRKGEKEKYEDLMDIRDALESISSALKMQYQGVSRMLSVKELEGDTNGMWEYRKAKEETNGNPNYVRQPAWKNQG